MPMINLYFLESEVRRVVYRLYDPELSSLLLNAGRIEGVRLLSEIDDQAPAVFSGVNEYSCLMQELLLIAKDKNIFCSKKVGPALVELMAVIKLAAWSPNLSLLEFSGVGASLSEYPQCIPEKLRGSLGGIQLCLQDYWGN